MRRLLTIVAGVVVTLTAAPAMANAPEPVGVVHDMVSRPCAQEDSPNCYWNAEVQGIPGGHSFYQVRVGRKMCTIYWNRAYNRRHGRCYKP